MLPNVDLSVNLKNRLRFRYQLFVGILICTGIPIVFLFFFTSEFDKNIGLEFEDLLSRSSTLNSIISGVLSIIIGFFFSLELGKIPGKFIGRDIITSYTISFFLVIVLLFIFRIDYSRFLLFSSFALSLIYFSATQIIFQSRFKEIYFKVPGGRVDALPESHNVSFVTYNNSQKTLHHVDGIVADMHHDFSIEWQKFMMECALRGIPVYHFKQMLEHATGSVSVDNFYERNFGFLQPNILYVRVKSVLDFLACLIIAPLFLIVGGIIALIIFATCGRPIFFIQKRVGFRGKIFSMVKFRTMRNEIVPDCTLPDQTAPDTKEPNPSAEPKAQKTAILERAKTKEHDSRITRFGHVLRKYRLDELPQIINIIRGDMSWIGPRPEEQNLSKHYETRTPQYLYRHLVKPGITGWAQVKQGHVTDDNEVQIKFGYDLFYIKYISIWLDTVIVIRTIVVMLRGFGAK